MNLQVKKLRLRQSRDGVYPKSKFKLIKKVCVYFDGFWTRPFPHCSHPGWLMGWEQPCREGLHDTSGWKMEYEPAMCTCTPESQLYTELLINKYGQQVEGGISIALSSYSTLMGPDLEVCIQLRVSQYMKDKDLLEWLKRRARKIIRGLEHLSCGGSREGIGVVQPWEGKSKEIV